MIIERTIAPVFAANCYVIAPKNGSQAIVVDPGAGSAAGAVALLRSHQLTLGCVLLTHGHADHCWDTARLISLCADAQLLPPGHTTIPVYIPEPDLYRLDAPHTYTGGARTFGATFPQMAGSEWVKPDDVRPLPQSMFTQAEELVDGIAMRAVPAPGHTEGSSLIFFEGSLDDDGMLIEAEVEADDSAPELFALDGDVIFKGAVGRTDLPGGDQVQMMATLRFLAQAVSPSTILLPGHGAITTMKHEHHANPYLAEAKVYGGEQSL
ncbi:MBL fold metallo-hydrolase [Actinomyces vulturis]|uniref:MBL fold metallo-hydrolase n=1 Tax=Actinomyces vulturis TaxID=1857645 RepID=UPI000830BB37|nr:MBL fold metallo-hydrolase [Actinomyces vulturis]